VAFSLVAHTLANGDPSVTTSGIDTSGADLLVVGIAINEQNESITFSDSKSNTWALKSFGNGVAGTGNSPSVLLYRAYNAVVGSGHTITVTYPHSGTFVSAALLAFSGSLVSSDPYDTQNANQNTAGAATVATGSVTPAENNELLVSIAAFENLAGSGYSTDGGFTISDTSSSARECAIGYLIQTTASAVNLTWASNAGSAQNATALAVFKSSGDPVITPQGLMPLYVKQKVRPHRFRPGHAR
jgi:hypothetical protein